MSGRNAGLIWLMKAELNMYLAQNRLAPPKKAIAEKRYTSALSERQQEVLDYMAGGMVNKEIAVKRCILENTVNYHIKNIYLLLEIKDRKDLLSNMNK